MPDEAGHDIDALTRTFAEFIAPWLLWAEYRNILVVAERRGRIPPGLAEQAIEAVEGLGISLDRLPSSAAVLSLSRQHGLTVYDALYLELAVRRNAALATLDSALERAAVAEGVRLA